MALIKPNSDRSVALFVQVGNKIKFMRKQHMALKAMMMANKPVPANKMSPHFKALDGIFSKDPSSSPLNKALEKCLGGKVKVINPAKGEPYLK